VTVGRLCQTPNRVAPAFHRNALQNEIAITSGKICLNNACWGCGPANAEGLHIRSFPKNGEVVAEWKPEKKYEAFDEF